MSDAFWPKANVERLRSVIQYAASKGLYVVGLAAPYGWSNAALATNGNWAEAQRVIGAQFKVNPSATKLDFINSFPPLANAGFENGRSAWFTTNDPGTGLSENAHSGTHAAVILDAPGNARFRQKILLTPWRQYHLRLWFKSSKFTGAGAVEIQDWWHRKVLRFRADLDARGTHDWTAVDYSFSSQGTTSAYLYFGVWGGSHGTLWFDDVELEETALVYVARREGTPLRIYSPYDRTREFREGEDYLRIHDPVLGPPKGAFRDLYHAPPVVVLPSSTKLRPHQIVAIDYYAIFPLATDQQVAMCLTEPAALRWVLNNARAISTVLPSTSGLLLSWDEIRQMNSCASCRGRQLSAGNLLASNVKQVETMLRASGSSAGFYVWSDMFDPYGNARSNYYSVEGDIAGSWKGLSPDTTVMNWNRSHMHDSLVWFAGLKPGQPVHHSQLIASFYDSGNPGEIEQELSSARGIPGLRGAIYVTWQDDYSQLERFAAAARRGWDSYTKLSTSPN